MGYRFKGIVTLDPRAAEVALENWPFCQLKHEEQQFNGFILRCPDEDDLHPTDGDAEWERVLDQANQVRSGLPALSNRFPESWLIYVEVECFGGACQHTGAQYLAGSVAATFEAGEGEVDLARILLPLGIKFDEDQHFRPLMRGYFERRSHRGNEV
jgi:hypothetical protein